MNQIEKKFTTMAEQNKNYGTHLSDDELEHFKEKLLKEKEESEKEIERLKERAENIEDDFDDRQSGQDHHPGDVASDAQIKKTSFTLLEKQREKHQKIEAALERIEAGTYGICLISGEPIKKERLEAIPYAMHSVDAKSES
jgi:RNA polymerase-binding protein DksA